MKARSLNRYSIALLVLISFFCAAQPVQGAQNRTTRAAEFVAQQQAEERYRRLYSIVEDLQAANVLLQQRIERLEGKLVISETKLRDQEANSATQDQLEALGEKFATELQKIEDKRVADNKRILTELTKMTNRPAPIPEPQVTVKETAKPEPYTGPVFEVTIEQGYTLAGIAMKYREQGHNITVDDIMRANPGINPRRLKLGQTINIPAEP